MNSDYADSREDSVESEFNCSTNVEREHIEVKRERFWVLFLFSCSTMINACGWI